MSAANVSWALTTTSPLPLTSTATCWLVSASLSNSPEPLRSRVSVCTLPLAAIYPIR